METGSILRWSVTEELARYVKMLYIIEYGQPCQAWGCPQMTSDLAREIIPRSSCDNYPKTKCNCCYDCWRVCCLERQRDEYYSEL